MDLPPLSFCPKKVETLRDIGRSKPLAKFGDIVTNFIYSLAKSEIIGYPDARKVNKKVLSTALKNAELKTAATRRPDAHDLADSAEAFIGYVYCMQIWTMEQMAVILQKSMQGKDLVNYAEEMEAAKVAFSLLLQKIKTILTDQYHLK